MLIKSWFWSVKLYIGRSRASESSWCPMLAGHEGVFLAAREDTSEDKMARMDVWTHERIAGWNPWIYIQWHAPKSRYNNISAEHRGPQIDCPATSYSYAPHLLLIDHPSCTPTHKWPPSASFWNYQRKQHYRQLLQPTDSCCLFSYLMFYILSMINRENHFYIQFCVATYLMLNLSNPQ